MPSLSRIPSAPIEGDPEPAPFSREREGPQYNSEGLYIHGPKRARAITDRLAKLTLSRCPEPALSPRAAREQAERKRHLARVALARAIMGAPAGRTRRAA